MSSSFLRPGFRIASALPQAVKCSIRANATPSRTFHSSPLKAFRPQASRTTLTATISRQLPKNPFRIQFRGYQSQGQAYQPVNDQTKWRKIATSAAIFGGTLVAINVVFNGEGRTDGGMTPYQRSYLNDAFLHTGLGIGVIALSARQMLTSGFIFKIMSANPWVVAIGGLGASFATMIGTRAINPDNYIPKYAMWTAFNVTQAAIIAPLALMAPPAILARAGLYTVAMMGGLTVVGTTAREDKYLYIGGPLMAGACVVIAAGLAPLVIPATATRALMLSEQLWLYGGLALTGGFTLFHVQAVQQRANVAERGLIKKDAVNEAVAFELDFLNIFMRIVYILMARSNNRK